MKTNRAGHPIPETDRDALDLIDADWHPTSGRPCPTCDPISTLIGRPWGCARYRIEYPGSHGSDYAEPGRTGRRAIIGIGVTRDSLATAMFARYGNVLRDTPSVTVPSGPLTGARGLEWWLEDADYVLAYARKYPNG